RFAKFVEQARVLDGDDGLRGEVLDQLDLFVGEGPNLLAINADRSNELVFLEHRHPEPRARARQFDKANHEVIALDVSLLSREVVNVDYLLRSGDAGERDIRMIAYVNHRLSLP